MGHEIVELIGNKPDGFLSPANAASAERGFQETLRGGKSTYVDDVFHHPDGDRWFRSYRSPFYDADKPCETCRIQECLDGHSLRYEWRTPDKKKTCEVLDVPYLSHLTGEPCKMTIFTDVTERVDAVLKVATDPAPGVPRQPGSGDRARLQQHPGRGHRLIPVGFPEGRRFDGQRGTGPQNIGRQSATSRSLHDRLLRVQPGTVRRDRRHPAASQTFQPGRPGGLSQRSAGSVGTNVQG